MIEAPVLVLGSIGADPLCTAPELTTPDIYVGT